MSTRARQLPRRARMYRHILESYLDRGRSLAEAEKLAAATTNKYRAAHACRGRKCRRGSGPRLVGAGGSRVQWWPGKQAKRERFVCLAHEKKFKTRGALKRHYREVHGR